MADETKGRLNIGEAVLTTAKPTSLKPDSEGIQLFNGTLDILLLSFFM